MKKLTTSVLAVVLTSSSLVMINAQSRRDTTAKTKDIEGVVVTALGIKREKKSLGYSAQEVKGEVISNARQQNAVSALSGNVAGLQVTAPSTMGGSARITLRGISSVTGNNRPLIVIDGIPMDNSNYNSDSTQRGSGGRDYGDASADINPDDIASVTVLKGGPAAALYGSRGANGVILYTTKSASKGRTEITYSTGVTLESVYKMPKLQNLYGGGASDKFETVDINGRTYNIADYATDESWGPKYDPNLMYLPWYAFDPEYSSDYLKEVPWVAPKKNVKDFFRMGTTYTNNFSIAKSFNDLNVRLAYANSKAEGIVPNSNLQRNNLSINANAKLNDRLTAEAFANYTLTVGFNRPEQGYGDNSVSQKFFQWGQRQLDMSKLRDYKLSSGNQRSWNRTGWNDATPAYADNPYWVVNENISNDRRSRLYGNAGLNYKITDKLQATGKVYLDTYSFYLDERVAIGSQAQPHFTLRNRNFQELNYEGRLQYNDSWFSDNVSVTAMAGINRRENRYFSNSGATVGGMVIPNFYNLTNSVEQARATNYQERMRVNSMFGMASVGFRDILFLEGTARYDHFSTVKDPGFYPSLSGSFVFSQVLKQNWLSYGKLRAGWSRVSGAEGAYRLEDYADSRVPFNGIPRYSFPDIKNNENLKPEYRTTKEIGLETRFFRNRLGFDVTYYDILTTDLITPVQYDFSTGYSNGKYLNVGKMQNKGIEASLYVTPIKSDNFSWDLTWNFAKNDNRLLELDGSATSLLLGQAPFRARLEARVGERYGQIVGTDYVYDNKGNKVVGSDGAYLASDVKSLGSIIPDYNMGLRNTIRFKNFTLSALIDMQKGGKYFSTTHMWGMYSGMLEASAANGIRENGIVLPGVKKDGSVNTTVLDGLKYAQNHSNTVDAQNVFNADYIKLRDLTLTYKLPKKLFGEVFNSVEATAFARNLFVWNLDWDIDPEQASYGSGNVQGLEGGSLPSTRTFGVSLQFKF